MLEDVKRDVLAGKPAVEKSWELLRLAEWPGLGHEEAAAKLGEWARENGIDVEFDAREYMAGKKVVPVIHVLFTAR